MRGQNKVLVIDASIAGISGDMFLAALIDLGANVRIIHEVSELIPKCLSGVSEVKIDVVDTLRKGFRAKKLNITIIEERRHRAGHELVKATECLLNKFEAPQEVRRFALSTIKTLVETEARIHGSNPHSVHLHEIGSADTVLDIVGSALVLNELGLYDAELYVLPIALGGGKVRIEHGLISCPAPATLEILRSKGYYVKGGPIEHELTTPTGAAILTSLNAKPTLFYPLMRIERIGYGAGSKDFNAIPNILRLVMGTLEDGLIREEVVMLETDVNDVTGEVLGHLIDKLMAEGARDVALIPTYRKKNRPGHLIRIVADDETYLKLLRILIEETGTLGVRYLRLPRFIVPIRMKVHVPIIINGREFTIVVKVSKDLHGNIIAMKPEYESLKKVSQEVGLPLRKVKELVYQKIRENMPLK